MTGSGNYESGEAYLCDWCAVRHPNGHACTDVSRARVVHGVAHPTVWGLNWCDAWLEIGWHASTDLLQAQLVNGLARVVGETNKAFQEVMSQLDNLRIDAAKMRRKQGLH